jgi:hypothetical protein
MYEFTFRVSVFSNKDGDYYLDEEKDAQKVAKWYSDVNAWRVGKDEESDELAFLSFEPVKDGRVYSMKCKFTMYTYSIHTNKNGEPLKTEIESEEAQLMDPDDDGNYPITLGGKEYLVMGHKNT